MDESPASIARGLIADVGRVDALIYLAGQAVRASTPRRSWRAVLLMVAVVRA